MTSEEKQLIKKGRVMIVGTNVLTCYIEDELRQLGFSNIQNFKAPEKILYEHTTGFIIYYSSFQPTWRSENICIPVIYPFDFIEGAGVIVMFPEDDRSWLYERNIRLWVAEYMSGYCAFWNVEGCDWLHDALPAIKKNSTSEAALKTAAYMCSRIAANIAVNRDVKRFPRFYLSRNLK